ncbi:MAG: hypothetical protein C3F12_02120 [Candidatus Methylomirabilota bacterium]|nr:ATP-grasp domain-containing protein [Candidatus Methylomirabilis sp.]PWB48577.1 MAG: hypothetical protein C3F12_02120 [candidate division NC10 bacterium]
MKIFVHECITAGGLGEGPVPATLLAEGRMMLQALLADLLDLQEHRLVVQVDRRYLPQLRPHPGLQIVDSRDGYHHTFRQMVVEADATFLIAPETDGRLEAITAIVERCGKLVVGSGTAGVKVAGNKMLTHRWLEEHGISTPETIHLRPVDDPLSIDRRLSYPVVAKPIDGVGCDGVFIAQRPSELERTAATARQTTPGKDLLLQHYIDGVHASVSLLTDGSRSVPLTLNHQEIRGRSRLTYYGGCVPFEHPLRTLAFHRAAEVVQAIPGLKGYVGIDLVLTDDDAVVIEVNPRLTTSYVGLRKVLRQNLAALMLDAAAGKLPDPADIDIIGSAHFTTRDGTITVSEGVR